jgi:hypothetical protein
LRGGVGAVESRPLRHGIKLAAAGAQAGACLSITFDERPAREAVQQLTRYALPSWEKLCAGGERGACRAPQKLR